MRQEKAVKPTAYKVVLRRENGRLVKESQRTSRYAAKKLAEVWGEIYDDTYTVEIEVVPL